MQQHRRGSNPRPASLGRATRTREPGHCSAHVPVAARRYACAPLGRALRVPKPRRCTAQAPPSAPHYACACSRGRLERQTVGGNRQGALPTAREKTVAEPAGIDCSTASQGLVDLKAIYEFSGACVLLPGGLTLTKLGRFAAQSDENVRTPLPRACAHAYCCLRHRTYAAAIPPIGHEGAPETAETTAPTGLTRSRAAASGAPFLLSREGRGKTQLGRG